MDNKSIYKNGEYLREKTKGYGTKKLEWELVLR